MASGDSGHRPPSTGLPAYPSTSPLTPPSQTPPGYPSYPARLDPPASGPPPLPAYRPPPSEAPSVPAPADTDLRRLRGAYRWLRRSLTVGLLGYFTGFLGLAAYAPELLARQIFGAINLGIFLGLLLLPLLLLTVITYELLARITVDPISHRVRIAEDEKREREAESEDGGWGL
jgi:uncharacterized membrane protein (DUF485 family)